MRLNHVRNRGVRLSWSESCLVTIANSEEQRRGLAEYEFLIVPSEPNDRSGLASLTFEQLLLEMREASTDEAILLLSGTPETLRAPASSHVETRCFIY